MKREPLFSLPGTILREAACFLIALYQCVLAPILGGRCRFYPSCSHYAAEAIRGSGVIRGIFFALRRVMRCHPFHPGGVDYFEQRT